MTFSLFAPLAFLLGSSLIVLKSIAPQLFWLQCLWIAIGLMSFAFFRFFDPRFIVFSPRLIWSFYAVVLLLLIVVAFFGPVVRETRSWIRIGAFNLQPVELMKLSLILIYAWYFSRRHLGIAQWSIIITSFLFLVAPAILVFLQPDLGSASVLGFLWFGFLLVSGLPFRRLLILFSIVLVGLTLMWLFVFKEYHKERILNIFYPERHALTFNYNVIQSKIAIGSAGWFGKGYGQGSQVHAGFLPEAETDFIFAALIEEWGWLAGGLVVAALAWLIFSILKIGEVADQNIEKFICLGAAIVLIVQFFLNVGSVLGISPVIGVPFPLLSYGGSSLISTLLLLSLVYGLARRA